MTCADGRVYTSVGTEPIPIGLPRVIAKRLKRLLVILAVAALLPGAMGDALAGNKNAVDSTKKPPPDYLELPRMSVPVPVTGTDTFRDLEVVLWVYVPEPPLLVKLTARRSVVADTIRDMLKKNPADTYLSAEEGPAAIKEITRDVVENEIGKDADVDVLIKSLLVR
jgi:hypothetical protein